jgi:hypothetical protein
MHQFFCESTGHHSGGQSLFKWCKDSDVHPADLFIAWALQTWCGRCAEIDLAKHFLKTWDERQQVGLLNRNARPGAKRTTSGSIDTY